MFSRVALIVVRTASSPLRSCGPFSKRFKSTSSALPVVGCGSNVVDHFYKVRAIPKPGEKGFFESPTKFREDSIVGGVTLNHLSWSTLLDVPCGLFALQGEDASGCLIREKLKTLGVSTDLLQVSNKYVTAESYILLQTDGERSIIMGSGATSLIDDKVVEEYFKSAIMEAKIVTTEISQVPLSGVLAILKNSKVADNLSILDVDVSPSVAMNEARLGSLKQIFECVKAADVLKPAKHAAVELVHLLGTDTSNLSTSELTSELQRLTGAKLVALTDGENGCILATKDSVVQVDPFKLDTVVDATGAGDAFLGGLLAGLYHVPQSFESESGLRNLGLLANATGASCCSVLGALPNASSGDFLVDLLHQGMQKNESEFADFLSHLPESEVAKAQQPGKTSEETMFQSFVDDCLSVSQTAEIIDIASLEGVVDEIEITTNKKGRIFVTGIGKSGLVAQRTAASLTSIGHAAQFVHGTEWVHGDLGGLREGDCVLMFSHSGFTNECVQLFPHLKERGVMTMAIVANPFSPMATESHVAVVYAAAEEPAGGVPTSSIVVQEALVNAIMKELIVRGDITKETFAFNHPGGSIGKKANQPWGAITK